MSSSKLYWHHSSPLPYCVYVRTGICLKARLTLIMGENDESRNRWKYQGDIQQIAKDEHVANIPLPHPIYGCKFEAKGKRICVVPREPMDNHMKFIDGSDPGEPPHVMLAVDQNDQVRAWKIRTIHQHEATTVDYGGAYWLNRWTHLSQQQQKRYTYPLPTGMAAHAGRRNNREESWRTGMGICCSIQEHL